LHVKWR